MMDHDACREHGAHAAGKRLIQDPLFLTLTGLGILLLISFFVHGLEHFRHAFLAYLKIMALPVALGLGIGGVIDYFIPQTYISKFLAGRRKRTIFYSVALGFLASACSHGVLAVSMELHKKGASGPAVVSFLLASPWASLPITILLIGFFGWKAFLIIGAALFVAVTTGLLMQVLEHFNMIEHNEQSISVDSDFSIRHDLWKRWLAYSWSVSGMMRDASGILKGMKHLAQMILWWILIGILLASLASAYVPGTIFHRYFAANWVGLLVTIALAAVLEVCSEGTSPLAFEIYRQTGAFGNAFAFLMGGVVTDFTEVGLVWMNVGRRTAIWMISLTLPQVLAIGLLYNSFF